MALGRKTGGRKKGTPNRVNTALKEAILMAAEGAHPEGIVGYLRAQANENPTAFLTLLGKVLPMTIAGERDELRVTEIRWTIVDPSAGEDLG